MPTMFNRITLSPLILLILSCLQCTSTRYPYPGEGEPVVEENEIDRTDVSQNVAKTPKNNDAEKTEKDKKE